MFLASVFPKGKRNDLVDSMTQALKYLRDVGMAQNDEEVRAEENQAIASATNRLISVARS